MMRCSVLQCVAVCCSMLQCVAVCCSVLQCVAVCCSVSPCVAVCCSVLQCVAVCCSAYLIILGFQHELAIALAFPLLFYFLFGKLSHKICTWQYVKVTGHVCVNSAKEAYTSLQKNSTPCAQNPHLKKIAHTHMETHMDTYTHTHADTDADIDTDADADTDADVGADTDRDRDRDRDI